MEAFGYFRVTGLVHKDNLRRISRKPLGEPGGFFGAGCRGLDGLGGWILGFLRMGFRGSFGIGEQDFGDWMD